MGQRGQPPGHSLAPVTGWGREKGTGWNPVHEGGGGVDTPKGRSKDLIGVLRGLQGGGQAQDLE
jgi:hypothetical protein